MRVHCLFDTSDREAHSSLLRNTIFKNPIRFLRSAPDIVAVESAREFSARVYFRNLCVGTISNNHFMSEFVVGLKTCAANAHLTGCGAGSVSFGTQAVAPPNHEIHASAPQSS